MATRDRLGELLVREKLISQLQLEAALSDPLLDRTSLGCALVKTGFISDEQLTGFLSRQYGVRSIDLAAFGIDEEVVKLVPKEICERHKVLAVSWKGSTPVHAMADRSPYRAAPERPRRTGSTLVLAMADPSNLRAIDDIRFLTGYNVEPVVASEFALDAAIERYCATTGAAGEEHDISADDLKRASQDAPVVRLCNVILLDAVKQCASDIHLEPDERQLRLRYVVDGVFHDETSPPMKLRKAITARFKLMADLDIAERGLPQEGCISLKLANGRQMDFRVSVLPTTWGEKIVMRLAEKSNVQLDGKAVEK